MIKLSLRGAGFSLSFCSLLLSGSLRQRFEFRRLTYAGTRQRAMWKPRRYNAFGRHATVTVLSALEEGQTRSLLSPAESHVDRSLLVPRISSLLTSSPQVLLDAPESGE